MLAIGGVIFMLALSAPTITGPALMHILWLIWMIIGVALIGVSAGLAISVFVFKKK